MFAAVTGDVDPGGQKYPAAQTPEHAAVVIADTLPNVPAGHSEHVAAPASANDPGAHGCAVGVVDPSTHM